MQNIFYLLRRFPANIIPTVMAAGRAGGTVIVNTSSILKTIVVVLIPIYIFLGTDIIIPMIAKMNKTNINFIESEQNLKFEFFGYNNDLTKAPLVVANPVLVTKAKIPVFTLE